MSILLQQYTLHINKMIKPSFESISNNNLIVFSGLITELQPYSNVIYKGKELYFSDSIKQIQSIRKDILNSERQFYLLSKDFFGLVSCLIKCKHEKIYLEISPNLINLPIDKIMKKTGISLELLNELSEQTIN